MLAAMEFPQLQPPVLPFEPPDRTSAPVMFAVDSTVTETYFALKSVETLKEVARRSPIAAVSLPFSYRKPTVRSSLSFAPIARADVLSIRAPSAP